MTTNYGAINKIINFSVDGSPVKARRTVVATAKCNACHSFLSLHGENRNQVEQCVLCHNPNQNDAGFRPAGQGPPQTVNFAQMIHKIHTGEELQADGGSLIIYGFRRLQERLQRCALPGRPARLLYLPREWLRATAAAGRPAAGQRSARADPFRWVPSPRRVRVAM